MQAMDAATKNAGGACSLNHLIDKGVQESITTELVEINAGVETPRNLIFGKGVSMQGKLFK